MTRDIRFERHGRLGVVILDRQQALNALTHAMVRSLSLQLARWREDDGIGAVLVKAAPGRAFCAGGDIVAVAELLRTGGVAAAVPFFRDEYRLNWRIHTYPKPYIAFIDGITMGGGVGISVHGDFRVATERTLFAMPETGIGFFPDVGGTWFLPRCPGEVGMYLGLTGARLRGVDCVDAGVATHAAPAAELAEIESRLIGCAGTDNPYSAISSLLAGHELEPQETVLRSQRPTIDRCFAADTLAGVLQLLAEEPGGFGGAQLVELGAKSPCALALTFAQLRRGRGLAIEEALRLEYRMVHGVLSGHDFVEGVRALLVAKDRRPRWQPASLAEVTDAEIAACMKASTGGDLRFD
jgi:enoyl-CoA hydratase/carnithine racemase